MNKKTQLLISVILLLTFMSAIDFSTNFRRDENGKISYKEVNSIIRKDKNINNTDVYKYKNDCDVAMGTDIYYPVNNHITRFGGIGSNGTAYPISADKSGIYTSGGHNVAKYGLDVKGSKLKLIYKYIM